MRAGNDAVDIIRLKAEMAAARVLLAGWRLQLLLKYNPDWDRQPRVSAGRPNGGQWTNGGSGGNAVEISEAVDPIQTQATVDPDPDRYSVNLEDEEAPIGVGHTIRKHVGKSDAELLKTIEANTYRGWLFDVVDYREGSFKSLEAANDFTNLALRRNKAIVDLVASGELKERFIEQRFGYRTGREARRTDADAEPYIRDTYGVGVLIGHDLGVKRRYRVITSYPRND